jgi:hypothetical protein
MNIMDAIFGVLEVDDDEEDFTQSYHIDQTVIYLIYAP